MPDIFSKAKRSEVMSHIRGKGNKDTELALIAIFRRHRIAGWRRHQKVFGKPDFVFPKQRLAVFVDGCFWHGCPRHGAKPKTNKRFWAHKLAANRSRDRQVNSILTSRGWCLLRVWEHDLRAGSEPHIVRRLLAAGCRPTSPTAMRTSPLAPRRDGFGGAV